MKTYHANGKLLLTGEYLVLHGAIAIGLPTKFGQSLTVETAPGPSLHWSAYTPTGLWFTATFDPETLNKLDTTDPAKAEKLSQILKAVRELNPAAIQPGLSFETHLDFNPEWGLGSSSTLISTLAQWAAVDPYQLLKMTFGGSGYDIACATASTPIHYRIYQDIPQYYPVEFNPPFADHLFFVYQGRKQKSLKEVTDFNQRWQQNDFSHDIQSISELSMALPTLTYFEDFCTLLQIHENIIANCLSRDTVAAQFPDFDGVLKSLGAWGGDFLLAATPMSYEQTAEYFKNKGLDTIFNYHDIIL